MLLVPQPMQMGNGEWGIPLGSEQTYRFKFTKTDYAPITKNNISFNKKDELLAITAQKNMLAANDTKPVITASSKKIATRYVYFHLNKSRVRSEGRMRLEQIAYLTKQAPNRVIQIIGHTDASGKDDINLALSEKRAKNAEAYLLKLGIDASKITIVKGVGKQELTNNCIYYSKCSDEDNAANRRVEVKIYD